MTETDKTTGKVARIVTWTSGKGYFLNLQDDSNDYYGFMKCKAKVGETVDLEASEGTGNFADKIKIDKLYSKATVKEAVKETEDKDLKILNDSIKSGENTYFERQNLIIRQACIKAAASLAGSIAKNIDKANTKVAISMAEEIADALYAWVTESDQRLPEPPEEP